MKKHGNTNVPRKQQLNEALINAGHKVHADKRQKKLARDKRDKEDMEEEYFYD